MKNIITIKEKDIREKDDHYVNCMTKNYAKYNIKAVCKADHWVLTGTTENLKNYFQWKYNIVKDIEFFKGMSFEQFVKSFVF